jgi:hypothetical protein
MGRLISLLAVVLTGAAIALSADLFRMAGFSLYTEQVLAGLLAIATPLIFLHVSAAGERGRAGAVPRVRPRGGDHRLRRGRVPAKRRIFFCVT